MLSAQEIVNIVENDIQYKDYNIGVAFCNEGRLFMQVTTTKPCTTTGIHKLQSGRKWFLSKFMTKSEIVQTAFKAVLTYEEHEAREIFKYKGQAIFGPHYSVDLLAKIVAVGNHKDKRVGHCIHEQMKKVQENL